MIEAASRSLRQQMAQGRARDRPRSKGSLHDGTRGSSGTWSAELSKDTHSTGESAQRRIRSAENQHRLVSASRHGPHLTNPVSSAPPAAAALEGFPAEVDLEEAVQAASSAPLHTGLEEGGAPPHFPQDFPAELKRPLSRKKDPSASAAAGLGAFAGPARITDAFEQRKTRQPIPVESWGPRPPSRAGLPQKEAGVAGVGRPASKAGMSDQVALGSKVVGGTWAAARVEPRADARPEPRVTADPRRGRGERKAPTRGAPEAAYAQAQDLGVFGCGTRAPNQQLTKSLSAVFDYHNNQFPPDPSKVPVRQAPAHGTWAAHADTGALEVSGCGLDTSGPWTGGAEAGSPPTRKGARQLAAAENVSVEDVEGDGDLPHGSFRREVTPPQVIITRSAQGQLGKARSDLRRGADQRGSASSKERSMPFSTSLDVDFLSLFAF